ncbi:MAG: alkaline phosphatase family protein [Solimonas sp.]
MKRLTPRRIGTPLCLTAIAAATALLAACGGSSSSNGGGGAAISGKVAGAAVKYPGGYAQSSDKGFDTEHSSTGESVLWSAQPIAYSGATVCVDVNDNGLCDDGEDRTTSGGDGSFQLKSQQAGPLTATVTDAAGQKMILRAASEQRGGNVTVSALSTEVLRTMKTDALSFDDARAAIAKRLSLNNTPALDSDVTVSADQVLADLGSLGDAKARSALLFEERALQTRAALAAGMLARGYVTEAATDAVKTIQDAQAAAFNLEDIPRYDHLFVIIFENHSNSKIDDPQYPNFYKYLNTEGNKAANYFSTGNPSEPNYVSLASADDWGIANDSGWNCVPDGDTADQPSDVYNPRGSCTDSAVHNQKGRRNLFTALYQAGLGARVYSESMDPGQDPRVDGKGNPDNISGANKASGKVEPFIGDLYRTKHHPAMYFDEVRTRPDFFRNLGRSVGGGQWDTGIEAYAKSQGFSVNTHQFEDDLKSGDVGALNYIVPDQCDDVHTTGTEVGDCTSLAYLHSGIKRADAYAKYLVDAIQASPIWKNDARKVGIVFIFDEGTAFFGSSSCCGWNVGGGAQSFPQGEDIATPYASYGSGNKGDGPTIFGLLTNQAKAPKQIIDSDTYSHFSFVRTLQDMYGLADPGIDTSYMNRSKYTEKYIAAHIADLPEYEGSGDVHFDAVRAMNHHYVMKLGDRISGGLLPGSGGSGSTGVSLFALGPDKNQTNIWALK